MTTRIWVLAGVLLALLALSSCAPTELPRSERTDNKPHTSTGITVFGDAALGVVFD